MRAITVWRISVEGAALSKYVVFATFPQFLLVVVHHGCKREPLRLKMNRYWHTKQQKVGATPRFLQRKSRPRQVSNLSKRWSNHRNPEHALHLNTCWLD